MKFLLNFIFFLLLGFGTINAQEAIKQVEKVVEEKAIENKPIANSLLWAISGNGLKDTSYLYGTIHLIAKDDFFLTDKTKEAFDKSQKVTFEINMEDMMDMGAQMGLMMKAFMNDGTTLSDLLEEDRYKEVQEHFEKLGMNSFMWNMMERIKPMFLSVFGSMDMSGGGGLNTGEMMSYEMEFMEMAKGKEKSMGGLETAEYQMSMFDSIPYKAQAEMLVETIQASGEEGSDQLDEMVEMYKAQDLKAMEKMIAEGDEGLGEFAELLLNNRNRNWIPIMEKQMKEKATFFAVGAGHLGGEVGVVALLREAGYKVTAVDPVKP